MTTFSDLAEPWLMKGWQGTLPLPARAKFAPPAGFTGQTGIMPTTSQINQWKNSTGNIALRLPQNVVGIDIDAYGEKHGGETILSLETTLGKLPETVRISSRNNESGIYLFRNVSHKTLRGIAGPGIEIIQFSHRYAVGPGSIHPTTQGEYHLLAGDEILSESDYPTIRQLPRLPRKWVSYLEAADTTPVKTPRFTQQSGLETTEMCSWMHNAVTRLQNRMQSGNSRFETTLAATWNISRLSGEGHSGGTQAIRLIEELYVSSLVGERSEMVARAEFKRMTSKISIQNAGYCQHDNRKDS